MLNEMNILAIGAHPDDIELGCGGVLLKSINEGHNVYAYTLTRGSASGDPEKRCEGRPANALHLERWETLDARDGARLGKARHEGDRHY